MRGEAWRPRSSPRSVPGTGLRRTVCLADVLEATGRAEEATGALREALARHEAKGHAVDAARVRERLRTSG